LQLQPKHIGGEPIVERVRNLQDPGNGEAIPDRRLQRDYQPQEEIKAHPINEPIPEHMPGRNEPWEQVGIEEYNKENDLVID